jgi:hypothetical protein
VGTGKVGSGERFLHMEYAVRGLPKGSPLICVSGTVSYCFYAWRSLLPSLQNHDSRHFLFCKDVALGALAAANVEQINVVCVSA